MLGFTSGFEIARDARELVLEEGQGAARRHGLCVPRDMIRSSRAVCVLRHPGLLCPTAGHRAA